MNKMTMLVMFLSLAFVGKTEARGIPQQKPDMSIVLITGKRSDDSNQMEIINPDNSTKKCQNDYTYPISVHVASGAVVDGTIVVCGGWHPITKQCYSFGHDKEWKNITDMTTTRSGAASIPINNALWVGGGNDGSNRLKSTELVYLDGRRSSTKPQLPEVRYGSCAAEYNGNIFLTGGYDGSHIAQDNTWIINTNDDFKVTNETDMLKRRAHHSCGIFQSHAHSGRAVIVTAGSYPYYGATGSNNCEFWDFTVPGTTWQLCSQDLPTGMYEPRMTPTADGKGLLLSFEHSIYSFICQSETSCWFTTTDIQLKIRRRSHLMFTVPTSLLSEC